MLQYDSYEKYLIQLLLLAMCIINFRRQRLYKRPEAMFRKLMQQKRSNVTA